MESSLSGVKILHFASQECVWFEYIRSVEVNSLIQIDDFLRYRDEEFVIMNDDNFAMNLYKCAGFERSIDSSQFPRVNELYLIRKARDLSRGLFQVCRDTFQQWRSFLFEYELDL